METDMDGLPTLAELERIELKRINDSLNLIWPDIEKNDLRAIMLGLQLLDRKRVLLSV